MFQRTCSPTAATIATTLAVATAIPFRNYSGGQVYLGSASAITGIAWHGSYDGVTFTPIYDGKGNAVTSTIAAGSAGENCLIPAACFACAFLKGIGTFSSGTSEVVNMSLKS